MTAIIQGAARREQKTSAMNREAGVRLRIRRALWLVLGMLSLSVLLVVLGVHTTTRTQSLNVTGYTSGVILTLGSFLGLLGLLLEENRKHLLTAAIVSLSIGIITSFLCLLIDGVCIALNMDIAPLKAGRCQYYSGGSSYSYETFYGTVSKNTDQDWFCHLKVPCQGLKESCNMSIRSGTCYCCDLFNCANGDYLNKYYEFVGLRSCEDVFTLYVFIWTLASLNLVAFFTGTLTTAVLGSVKLLTTSLFIDSAESRGSSPTAPLLMDTSSHTAQQLCPAASVLDSQSPPSSVAQLADFPFNSLSHKVQWTPCMSSTNHSRHAALKPVGEQPVAQNCEKNSQHSAAVSLNSKCL